MHSRIPGVALRIEDSRIKYFNLQTQIRGMNETVPEPWAGDATVHDMTDTDLQAGRTASIGISYNNETVPRMVETLRVSQGLETLSVAADRALRIELAYAIDHYEVQFTRDEYDIGVLIPPIGWVDDHMTIYDKEVETVEDISHPIFCTTPQVLDKMVEAAVEEGAYQTKKGTVIAGLRRQCGRIK